MSEQAKLLPFQAIGVRRISRFDGRVLLADEMGLGKTFQALEWAKRHNEFPVLVVCPATLKINWARECWDKIGVRAAVLSGRKPPAADRRAIKRKLAEARIVIINYDILQGWMRILYGLNFKTLVLDECDRVTGRKTKRTVKAGCLARRIPNMIAISGTPMTNRPAELWPVLNMLYPEKFPSFTPFAIEYCQPKFEYGRWNYNGACNLKQLHTILKSTCMIRRKKKQVLKDLPDKRRSIIPLDLPAEGRREYERAKKDIAGWLKDNLSSERAKKALKAEALVRTGYLKRIAAQWKMKLVIEWIEDFMRDCDRKLIMFCVHRDIAKTLKDHFKDVAVVVNGTTGDKHRQLNVDAFKHSNKVRLFIGNIKAAGVGLNLTEASDVAFCEVGWNPAELLQAEDRAHRIGQKKKVSIWFLLAVDTIEETLYKILQKKQRNFGKTFDGKMDKDDLDIWSLLQAELANGR